MAILWRDFIRWATANDNQPKPRGVFVARTRVRDAAYTPDRTSPEVIAAAKDYIAKGYSIVAVRADKKPWGNLDDGKDWRRHFTLEEILDRLNRNCRAIGFLGGELNNNIVPLDFDTEEGERWWRQQCEAAGIDPDDFPTVITPGKVKDGARRPGRHRYVTDIAAPSAIVKVL
jgi:hypothetical protein